MRLVRGGLAARRGSGRRGWSLRRSWLGCCGLLGQDRVSDHGEEGENSFG